MPRSAMSARLRSPASSGTPSPSVTKLTAKPKPDPAGDLYRQIEASGLPMPVREYPFVPGRQFRADFAYPNERVVVEVEGGIWAQGRHTRGSGYETDCLKYSLGAIAGWCIVRVTPGMVADGRALALIREALDACKAPRDWLAQILGGASDACERGGAMS